MPEINTQELQIMSKQITGKINQETMSKLKELHTNSPLIFDQYKQKFDEHYKNETILAQANKIPADTLAKMQISIMSEIPKIQAKELRETMYQTGLNACNTFDAIGKITKSPELSKAAEFSALSLKFADQLVNIQGIIQNGAAAIASLATPVTAILVIGGQILSSFMEPSGPSFEEIMMEQLQAISQQIVELGEQIRKDFKEVYDKLDLIHKTVLDCAKILHISLSNQIQEFKNYVKTDLEKINNNIENIRKIIIIGNHENLTCLCKDVEAIFNGQVTIINQATIENLANQLENSWLLSQSFLGSLNGSSVFMKGNYDNDTKFLNSSPSHLINILGYLALTAQDMGFNFNNDKNGIPAVVTSKIINPNVFNMALTEYLKLRRAFPKYVVDNEHGERFDKILSLSENSLNFIKKIQADKSFFNDLFDNYKSALHETSHAAEQHIDSVNEEYKQSMDCDVLDLRDDFDDLKKIFKQSVPENQQRDHGVDFFKQGKTPELAQDLAWRYPRLKQSFKKRLPKDPLIVADDYPDQLPKIDLNQFAIYDNDLFSFPEEMLIAEAFGLGKIKASYSTLAISHRRSSTGLIASDYMGKIIDCTTISPVYSRVERYQGYLRVTIKFDFNDKFQHICLIETEIGKHNDTPLIDRLLTPPEALKAHREYNAGSGYSNMVDYIDWYQSVGIKSLNSPSEMFTYFKVKPMYQPKTELAIQQWRNQVNSQIIKIRKDLILNRLLSGGSFEFNKALLHLDSAKARLLAFSSVAGFPEDMQQRILSLPSSKNVTDDFKSYGTDINAPYWKKPSNEEIDFIKEHFAQKIDNVLGGNDTFSSPIADTIQKDINLISTFKAMYVNYQAINVATKSRIPAQEAVAPIMPEQDAAERKARELGIDLAKLNDQFSGREVLGALVKAIIQRDVSDINIICQSYNNVSLTTELNTQLIRPLHLAAYIGDVPVIKRLMTDGNRLCSYNYLVEKNSAIVRRPTIDQMTPLMYAAMSGNIDAVKVIYEAGSDLLAKNRAGKTALDLAREYAFQDIQAYLNGMQQQNNRRCTIS
jgi:hypothetical protein